MREHRELNVEKLATVVALIFLTLTLCVIALTPPVAGYEISIYDAYPAYFWLLLTATITCGIAIFLLLPEFRGYALYGRGDPLTHLGFIKDILNTGHIGGRNFYPIVHILGTSLILVAGLSRESILSLFSVLFSGIYILNMYLLAGSVSKNWGQTLLTVVFASPLIYSFFHVTINPFVLSIFMVPCLLYFYQKREQAYYRRNTVLLLLLAFSITFFHPVTTLFVIVVFLTFGLTQFLHSRFLSHETSQTSQHRSVGKNFLGISLIMFIVFFTWYLSYALIQWSFRVVFDWLVYQIRNPLIETTLGSWAELDLTLLQTFELSTRKYGAVFLLLLISGMASISVLNKSLSTKHNVEPMNFTYAALFLVALFIGVGMLFGYFVEYNPVRVARFALLVGTIVNGLVVYSIIDKGSKKNIKNIKRKALSQRSGFMVAIAVVIIVMVALSLGSVYGSPSTCSPNAQVTQMDIAGTEWFGRTKDPDTIVVANIPEEIRRFEDYNLGVDSFPITRAKVYPERLPSHFGYNEHDQIAEALGLQHMYLVIFKRDKVWPMFFPEHVRPKVHQYTKEDFTRLNSDPIVAKLYCNGEFEVWMVYGGRE